MASGKKYGLIKPNLPGTFVPRPSIFGDDSEEDEGQCSSDWVKKAFQKETEQGKQKKQTKLDMERALQEDPTIYQYDEVYDKLEKKKMETLAAKKDVERKPKYIASLLLQAERRKRENERRTERQVQKEREAEGEEFKDKESFVTASYRAKIEEFNKQDEEERYREQLEAFSDVSQQKDLSGFYRHLYRQTVASDETAAPVKSEAGPASPPAPDPAPDPTPLGAGLPDMKQEKKERQYRKRRGSNSSQSESEEVNQDADSALEDSSSDSDEEGEKPKKKLRKVSELVDTGVADKDNEGELGAVKNLVDTAEVDKDDQDSSDESDKENEVCEEKTVIEIKPKINIWLKRTVGSVLDEALERYYARKAARNQS